MLNRLFAENQNPQIDFGDRSWRGNHQSKWQPHLGTTPSNSTSNWDLSSYRFGPNSAAGVLTLRASGNLVFYNALSDGFASSAFDAELLAQNPLLLPPTSNRGPIILRPAPILPPVIFIAFYPWTISGRTADRCYWERITARMSCLRHPEPAPGTRS